MADIILSFRGSAGFVTDAVGTYALSTDTYPTTRGGFTFGWTTGTDGVNRAGNDRDASVTDKRLAGTVQIVTSDQCLFRVDLPSTGSYTIRLASGDTGFDLSTFPGRQYIQILDNVTSKLIMSNSTTLPQDHYYDATGVDRTEAAWPGSNAASASLTFASTTLIMQVGNTTAGSETTYVPITHLQITTAAGGTTPKTFTATDSLAGGELL